jgi:small subunit ribosomal protein S20
MPHTPSAAKRLRKSEARRKRNRLAAKKIKTQRKASDVALKAGDAAKTATEFQTTQAMLDRAADKGYIHKNKAARLKSRLVKRLRAVAAAPAKA